MSDPLMSIYGDILNDRRKAMSHRDIYNFLPQLLVVLMDRAGGTIELSDRDVERIANMGRVELEYSRTDNFSARPVKIRYNERVNIQSDSFTYGCIICGGTIEVVDGTLQPHECQVSDKAKRYYANETVSIRDLLGAAPDFTGGLSVDEYMDEQRGRGQE